MFKTALNNNIIPQTWMLPKIFPIPKPNKDTYKGTSSKPISAKTLEKSHLPYITTNIPNTPMQMCTIHNTLQQGSGTFLTQRAMKAKYLQIYFGESHIIYLRLNSTKCEYNKSLTLNNVVIILNINATSGAAWIC